MVNFRYLPAGGNGIMLTSQTLTLLLWPHTCVKFLLQFHSLKPMIFLLSRKGPFSLWEGSNYNKGLDEQHIWDWVPNLSQRKKIAKAYIDVGLWVSPESQGYITSCLTQT